MNITSSISVTPKNNGSYRINSKRYFGEALVLDGIITEAQLQTALQFQRHSLKRIGQILVELGYAKEDTILNALRCHCNILVKGLSDDLGNSFKKNRMTFLNWLSALRIPINVRLSVTISLILGITIFLLSFIFISSQREQLYAQTLKMGIVNLNYFTNNAKVPLIEDNILRLNALIKESGAVDGLLYGIIVNRDDIIRAHTDFSRIGEKLETPKTAERIEKKGDIIYFNYTTPDGARILNISRTVSFKGKALGAVHTGISLDFINKQIYKRSIFIVFLSAAAISLGIIISIYFGLSFTRPISKLVLATKEISKGNFKYHIERIHNNELGDLAKSFNFMARELWLKSLMQKSFGRYVSSEVLNMILSNPEDSWIKGTRSESTILLTDIRGFTSYTESKEPEDVVEMLNEYFEIISTIILRYGGYVDKLIGDAVMGVFGVPVPIENHAKRAVMAAVDIQKELHQAGRDGNPLIARTGIGINSGMVVSGNLGSKIKMDYTVIGDSVNLASRLCSIAGSGDIIISENIFSLTKDIIFTKKLPPQKIKGKSDMIETYQVLDVKEDTIVRGSTNSNLFYYPK